MKALGCNTDVSYRYFKKKRILLCLEVTSDSRGFIKNPPRWFSYCSIVCWLGTLDFKYPCKKMKKICGKNVLCFILLYIGVLWKFFPLQVNIQVKPLPSRCWILPGLSLVSDPVCDFHGQDLEAQPLGRKCLVREPDCSLQMMWFCWLLRPVTPSRHWGGLRLSVKQSGWGSAPLSLRPWFLAEKWWIASSS